MQNTKQKIRLSLSQEGNDKIGSVSGDPTGFVVGITGTHKGMTKHQELQLRTLLGKIKSLYGGNDQSIWLAHGDCVGVDCEAHDIAKSFGYRVSLHPPTNDKLRAFVEGADNVWTPQLYSIRNHDIVRECDYLIGIPATANEVVRSGTWATVRYARKSKKPYTVIHPNGRMDGEGWAKVLSK